MVNTLNSLFIYNVDDPCEGNFSDLIDLYNQQKKLKQAQHMNSRFRNNNNNTTTNNHTHNHEASYNIHHPDKTRIGILNYFMRLELPTEPLLDGIKFASITSFIRSSKMFF